ncbi:TIM-barrel domain-containing protein [Streptomyces sp. WMMB 322]|uniref:TIM-barrel domain-containing protein n=1 Tax=Streptomyces sp. WMMB 322 TaxID=1286821 RepID=UPI0006E1FFE6|nr:TIM-barrel domain-containing protein [Streptomyces sp. WMMB 322]SCK57923.1 Glycosyl hydrolases family 31 [Streptomyces sp. WMMB 322]
MDGRGLVGTLRAAGAAWRARPGLSSWGRRRAAAGRGQSHSAERARVPGPATGALARPGGGVIRFGRSSLSVQVAVGGAVFLGWDGAQPGPSSALAGPAPGPDTRAVLEPDKDGGWRVVSERLLVTVSRHGTVEVRTPGGELLRRDLPPRWWEAAAEPASGARQRVAGGNGKSGETSGNGGGAAAGPVAGEEAAEDDGPGAPPGQGPTPSPSDGRWMQRSQVAADARFFGLGGHACGPPLPNGSYRLRAWDGARPDADRESGMPRITMPVQLVVADAGTHLVFHDNPGEGRVTVREGVEGRGSGHDRPGRSEIRMAGGPLRYWVIAGPPARVLHSWARLTGAPALPPGWALGHQYAGAHGGSGRRARDAVAGYRERELPLRALRLEEDSSPPGRRLLSGESGSPADLACLAAELRTDGVELVAPGAAGSAVTAAPEAPAEPDSPDAPAVSEPPDAGEAPGNSAGTGAGVRGGARAGGEFTLASSGWAGMQRGGGTRGGEVPTGWEGLRASLSLVIGLGLCGVPYSGPGIGGSTGTPSAELYLRWFQLAAWYPHFHAYGVKGSGPRQPWAFGSEVLEGCAAAMAERERLRPYFTTLAHVAHRTGAPYVRPLWWQHPRERPLRECGDAFLLGDALLVAPVLEEGTRRRAVRLPYGRWFETATGEVHEGPGEVLLDAPLSRIPVLARAGAAVPVTGADGSLELEVWTPAPGRRGKGLVIRDSGAGGADRPVPAERFTVVRREDTTVVTREDGAPAGYPVRVRG